MPAPALRLSDRQLKAVKVVKAKDKDYVPNDGDGFSSESGAMAQCCGTSTTASR